MSLCAVFSREGDTKQLEPVLTVLIRKQQTFL